MKTLRTLTLWHKKRFKIELQFDPARQWIGHDFLYRHKGENREMLENWVCILPCFPIHIVRYGRNVILGPGPHVF